MKRPTIVMMTVLVLTVVMAMAAYAIDVKAMRRVDDATDGKSKLVTLEIDLYGAAPSGFILKEVLPAGWVATESSPFYRTFDTASGEVKWLFMGASDAMTISYTVVPLGSAGAAFQPEGQVVFKDGQGARHTVGIR